MVYLDFAQIKTLPQLFHKACFLYTSKRAYTYRPMFRRFSWTYGEMGKHAAAFAQILKEEGIQKGDRVILIGFNSPFWVAAFFAIQLRGAVAVPLSPESNQEFIQKIIEQTKAKMMLKSSLVQTERIGMQTLAIENIPKPQGNTFLSLDNPEVDQDDIAEIVYTSGTTGDPKGVMLTHQNLLSNLKASREAISIHSNMRLISILPLFHMFEQMGGMFVPLSAGAQVSYAASLNPNHLKWIFQDDRINRMLAVPEFLRLLFLRIKARAKEQGKLKELHLLLGIARMIPFLSVRRIIFKHIHQSIGWEMHTIVCGGAPLEKEVGEFWEALGIYILQGYGLTETAPALTTNRYHEREGGSVGKPIEGVSLKIAPDGEILAKGPNVFGGYWGNKEKTNEVFTEGWLKTGDIGFFDHKGYLHVKGRKKFMIVLSSGEKVYGEDVESELNGEEGVLDSAVVGLKKAQTEEVHAVLLLKKDNRTDPKEIVARVNKRLLPYQRIQGFSIWPHEDFPRTPTRKLKKHEILAQISWNQEEVSLVDGMPPHLTKLESIIAQVLQIPLTEVADSKKFLADFQMDSLERIELVARIENELGISVDESEITQHTTIKDLKALVSRKNHKTIRHPFNPIPYAPSVVLARSLLQPLLLYPTLFLFAPMQAKGLERLTNLTHPVLFFSNHLSTADVPVIFGALPWKLRSKFAVAAGSDVLYEGKSLQIRFSKTLLEFLVPIFPFTRRIGQAKSSLEYTGRLIDRGFSILLFPEGQTSKTGEFQPLRQGAGILAIELEVPIVPLKVEGTQYIIPPGPEDAPPRFYWPKRHPVRVTFGEPFTIERTMGYRAATRFVEEKMRGV